MGLVARLLKSRQAAGPKRSEAEVLLKRHRRKERAAAGAKRWASTIATLMMLAGALWVLALPVQQLAKNSFDIDEHALQPGQANTYYGWGSVQNADRYLEKLMNWAGNGTSFAEMASLIRDEFAALGIQSDTQSYTFDTSFGPRTGKNVWAAFHPPRTSGTEAIVLAASWESLGFVGEHEGGVEEINRNDGGWEGRDKQPRLKNLRGIALLLSVAEYLRDKQHYAKTIIFVISDHHLDGMQAFLASYHGVEQSNLVAQDLKDLQKGVIWTALCVDYPGHSFSHLGVYFEGTNGRLPNQDLINAVVNVAQWKTSIPVQLYQQSTELSSPQTVPQGLPAGFKGLWAYLARYRALQEYVRAGANLAEHWRWAGTGRASGVHGVFLQYRIDAITIFALPAMGPHGFHSLGRLVEGSLRTMNNLLERLHASLFFYLFLGPGLYHKVGSYLPAAVLIGAGLSILGLSCWPNIVTPKQDGTRGTRPVLPAVAVVVFTHVVAAGTLATGTQLGWFEALLSPYTITFSNLAAASAGLLISMTLPRLINAAPAPRTVRRQRIAELARTLSILTHLLVGAVISTLSMLNFPQAIAFAAVTIPPLLVTAPSSAASTRPGWRRPVSAVVLAASSPLGVIGRLAVVSGEDVARAEVRALVSEWELLGDWCWVGTWVVWWAVWLQTLLASELVLG